MRLEEKIKEYANLAELVEAVTGFIKSEFPEEYKLENDVYLVMNVGIVGHPGKHPPNISIQNNGFVEMLNTFMSVRAHGAAGALADTYVALEMGKHHADINHPIGYHIHLNLSNSSIAMSSTKEDFDNYRLPVNKKITLLHALESFVE